MNKSPFNKMKTFILNSSVLTVLLYAVLVISVTAQSKKGKTNDAGLKYQAAIDHAYEKFKDLKEGSLKLFSPSDPKKDKSFVLERSNETMQIFSLDNVAKGMYRARMQWVMNGKEYYVEAVVNI